MAVKILTVKLNPNLNYAKQGMWPDDSLAFELEHLEVITRGSVFCNSEELMMAQSRIIFFHPPFPQKLCHQGESKVKLSS